MRLELKKIGNSTGLVLPKELLARMDLAQGDAVYVTEMPDGSLRLGPYDPAHAEAVELARSLFREYRDAFAALAR